MNIRRTDSKAIMKIKIISWQTECTITIVYTNRIDEAGTEVKSNSGGEIDNVGTLLYPDKNHQ